MIKNIVLDDVEINFGDLWSYCQNRVSLLVYNNSGTLSNCLVNDICLTNVVDFVEVDDVEVEMSSFAYSNSGIIYQCGVRTELVVDSNNASYSGFELYFAGLVINTGGGVIDQCFTDIDANFGAYNEIYYGAFTGSIGDTISNCYVQGSVNSEGSITTLIGFWGRKITNCYCALDINAEVEKFYFFKVSSGSETYCFCDNELSSNSSSEFYSTGLSTAEMKDVDTYLAAGWYFAVEGGTEGIWQILGENYPTLMWEGTPDINEDENVNIADMSILAANWMVAEPVNSGVDFDRSGIIDLVDLEIFSEYWLNKPYKEYEDIVGYWDFDQLENGVEDQSGLDNNGVILGDVVLAEGINGNCYQFNAEDGYDAVLVNSNMRIAGSHPRTISAYIRPDSEQPEVYGAIFCFGTRMDEEYFSLYLINNGDTKLLCRTMLGSVETINLDIMDNVWHHIAVVLPDGSSTIGDLQIYVDGVKVVSNVSGGGAEINTPLTNCFTIGGNLDSGFVTFGFTGGIDEVKVYGRGLSAEEISEMLILN